MPVSFTLSSSGSLRAPFAATLTLTSKHCSVAQDCKLSLPRVQALRTARWSPSKIRFCQNGCSCSLQHNIFSPATARAAPLRSLAPLAPLPLANPKVSITNTSDGGSSTALHSQEAAGSRTQVLVSGHFEEICLTAVWCTRCVCTNSFFATSHTHFLPCCCL